MTPREVAAALESVIDPELGISIVDLGLIYSIEIILEQVVVQMATTTSGCPMSDLLIVAAGDAVALRDSATVVEVRHVDTPPWEPGMLSQAARRKLGLSS